MEREQITKALECCTRGRKSKDDRPCLDCPYNECNLVGGTGERQITGTCQGWLMKDALSLINELTSKTEAQDIVITELRKLVEKADHDADRYARKIKELTEENERLRLIQLHVCVGDVITPEKKEELRAVAGHNDPVGEPGECGLHKQCQADTVRKMQSEIKDRCIKGGIYPAFVARVIEQVAKEMMEEEK